MPGSSKQNVARLFVAFPVPDIQREELKLIQQQNSSLTGIRWTPLPNLHLTIFFLGEVLEENIPQINDVISKVVEQTHPFIVQFEKIVLAGKMKHGGMIWARFFKNNFYTAISMDIYDAVKEYLIVQPMIKDPIPHITLARFKREAETEKINLSFEYNFSIPGINFCELWKSVQTKEGVIYKSLQRFELNKTHPEKQ